MAIKALVWLDLETTGSKPGKDFIIEVGVVVTRLDLTELGSYEQCVWLGPEAWQRLRGNNVVMQMHRDNGLLEDCETSDMSVADIDVELDEYIGEMLPELSGKELLLAGSGVSHFDRNFVRKDMPLLEERLHYPNLDIGVSRRMFQYFGAEAFIPPVPASYGDQKKHRALADVRGHIEEAKQYRRLFAAIQEAFGLPEGAGFQTLIDTVAGHSERIALLTAAAEQARS